MAISYGLNLIIKGLKKSHLDTIFTVSDLSHNKISDSGARAVGKLLNGRCNLTTLNLCDNKIRSNGAAAIGHALGKNTTLTSINLRLNRCVDVIFV